MESSEPSRRAVAISAALIGMLAIALRLPSCHESFWVDELHTAWAVSDGLPAVVDRAAEGHQTPLYFVGMWFWRQLAGDSEWALRLSSVLAVAAGCGVLVSTLSRATGALVAGVLSGLVLAVENNSLFFGTELRPYAWVMLFALVAVAAFVKLWTADSRHDLPGWWSALVIAGVLGMLAQPTSLGVLVWLPLALVVRWSWRDGRAVLRWNWLDGALLVILLAAIGATGWAVQETWQTRQIWAAFASAHSIRQIVSVWPWTSLLAVPMAVIAAGSLVALITGRRDRRSSDHRRGIGLAIGFLLAASAITILYWMIARTEWLPVWHRRYFIAVLPLFAAGAGFSAASVAKGFRNAAAGRRWAWLAATCILVGLLWQQRTAIRLWHDPTSLVRRGEDWRGAVAWIHSAGQNSEPVYVDAGLIESRVYLAASGKPGPVLTESQRRYLCYPVLGPYRIEPPQRAQPILPSLPPQALVGHRPSTPSEAGDRNARDPHARNDLPAEAKTADHVWLISRRPVMRLKDDLESNRSTGGARIPLGRAEYRGFGGVSVARIPLAPP